MVSNASIGRAAIEGEPLFSPFGRFA